MSIVYKISLYAFVCQMQSDRSAGKEWFDLPATTITPELKNDLRILKMRGALDPSRHYKKNDTKELPKYFQVCRIFNCIELHMYTCMHMYVFMCVCVAVHKTVVTVYMGQFGGVQY